MQVPVLCALCVRLPHPHTLLSVSPSGLSGDCPAPSTQETSVVVTLECSWHRVGGAQGAAHPPQCPGWPPENDPAPNVGSAEGETPPVKSACCFGRLGPQWEAQLQAPAPGTHHDHECSVPRQGTPWGVPGADRRGGVECQGALHALQQQQYIWMEPLLGHQGLTSKPSSRAREPIVG